MDYLQHPQWMKDGDGADTAASPAREATPPRAKRSHTKSSKKKSKKKRDGGLGRGGGGGGAGSPKKPGSSNQKHIPQFHHNAPTNVHDQVRGGGGDGGGGDGDDVKYDSAVSDVNRGLTYDDGDHAAPYLRHKDASLSPPLQRQMKKHKIEHKTSHTPSNAASSPGMNATTAASSDISLSGLTIRDPAIFSTPQNTAQRILGSKQKQDSTDGFENMEDLVTEASAREPARVLAALEAAATPLLETAASMIASLESGPGPRKPLSRMLQKTFSFFDIVIRAARTSTSLYRDVHGRLEEAEARVLLEKQGETKAKTEFQFTSEPQRRLKSCTLAFERLLKISEDALKEERDHGNLLVVCYNSGRKVDEKSKEHMASEELLKKSAARLASTRSAYALRVASLRQQFVDISRTDTTGSSGGDGDDDTWPHQLDLVETPLTTASVTTDNDESSTVDVESPDLKPWLRNLRGEQLERALEETAALKEQLADAEGRIFDAEALCNTISTENSSLREKLEKQLHLKPETNNVDAAATAKLKQQLEDAKSLLLDAEAVCESTAEENKALREQLDMLKSEGLLCEEEQKDEPTFTPPLPPLSPRPTSPFLSQATAETVDMAVAKAKQDMRAASAQATAVAVANAKREVQAACDEQITILESEAQATAVAVANAKHEVQTACDEQITILENEATRKQARIIELDCRIGALRMKYSALEKKMQQKNVYIAALEKQGTQSTEAITRLKEMVADADRQRARAFADATSSREKMAQAQRDAGPDLETVKEELASVREQLSRVRTARQSLIDKAVATTEKLEAFDQISATNAEMRLRIEELETQASSRAKLLAKLQKELTVSRIRKHRSGKDTSPKKERLRDDSYTNTPPRPGVVPFVLAGNGHLIHDFPPSPRSFNVKMGDASPRSTAHIGTTPGTPLDMPSTLSDLQMKLSAARSTIKVVREKDAARVAEMTAAAEAEEERTKKHAEEMSSLKDRLIRGEESLRKLRVAKQMLEKKLISMQGALVSQSKKLAETKTTAATSLASSKSANVLLMKKLTEARAANNNAEYLQFGTSDTADSRQTSPTSKACNDEQAAVANEDMKRESDQPKTPASISPEEMKAEADEESGDTREVAINFMSDCLLSALDKLRRGAKKNSHHGVDHADLRGFSGTMAPKEFSSQLRTQLGVRLTNQELEMLTFFFDQDRDGSISFAEVIRHLRGPKAMLEISSKRAASIATAFLDSDGDESGGREVGHGGIPDKLRISICSTASRHARRAKDDSDVIDLESVEQLRLRLRQACTTFKGIKPNKIFDRWDRNGDGDMSREEMRAGMERLLGGDVLGEWNMFDHFFAYVDVDSSGFIERSEFCDFVLTKPKMKVIRRKTDVNESNSSFFNSFGKKRSASASARARSSRSRAKANESRSRSRTPKRRGTRKISAKAAATRSPAEARRTRGRTKDRLVGRAARHPAPNVRHAHSKVDDHMSIKIMRATRKHEHDYVHERGLHTGDGPDVEHAHAKVHDHMSAEVMRATREHEHDYVHERGLDR